MRYLVTVKLPKDRNHDSKKKVTGKCPVTGLPCTDVTGQHHTILHISSHSVEEVAEVWSKTHYVTRVEMV